MKPYPQKKGEEIYNERLSRARSVAECLFGILTSKFAVFQKTAELLEKLRRTESYKGESGMLLKSLEINYVFITITKN